MYEGPCTYSHYYSVYTIYIVLIFYTVVSPSRGMCSDYGWLHDALKLCFKHTYTVAHDFVI
jgi:hypothetical protein